MTMANIHNPKPRESYGKMDILSDEGRQAFAILMDSLVKRSNMTRLLVA